MKNKPHILIERMLFGDYRVGVWDENLNSMLDKDYFCRGIISASSTALAVQAQLFPQLEIIEAKDDRLFTNRQLIS